MFRILALIATLASACSAWADKDFSSWRKFSQGSLLAENTSIAPGTKSLIGLRVTLADGWHTYWVNPGDSGAALRLEFHNSPDIRVTAVHMPVPERIKSGPLISFAYSHEVIFPIEIEVNRAARPGSKAQVAVDAEWLVCEEVCIPAIDTLKLDLPVTSLEGVRSTTGSAAIQRFLGEVPVASPEFPKFSNVARATTLEIGRWKGNLEFVDFFPFRGSGVSNEAPHASGTVLNFEKSNVPRASEDRVGVVVLRDSSSGALTRIQFGQPAWSFSQVGSEGGERSLWWMVVSAFLGGLILNLMPCVFPILSLKLLSILKISKSGAALIRRQNLGYVLGVLVSFLLIALLLAGLRSAGHLVGWGFQLQSPVFLAALAWLFMLLVLNLAGWVAIDLFDAGAGGRLARMGGFAGSFFTGVLAVVVASPCTAPFMGVALGFGLSQPTPVLILIFLSLGLGLSFPYALMIVVPSALWFLPRPGPWMDWLKKFLAIPLALTILWLIWVLFQIVGASGTVAAGLGLLAVTLFALIPMSRKLAWVGVSVSLTVAGLWINSRSGATSAVANGEWRPFSEGLMGELKGRNVFVNMTADWCLTCKVNERLLFSDPEVLRELRTRGVTLVMGDWTHRNGEITQFLTRYNRVGVPFYVFYSTRSPEGRVLPEVMTKSTFVEEIKSEFPLKEAP